MILKPDKIDLKSVSIKTDSKWKHSRSGKKYESQKLIESNFVQNSINLCFSICSILSSFVKYPISEVTVDGIELKAVDTSSTFSFINQCFVKQNTKFNSNHIMV